ncbi:MAG: hypothetical protein JXX29_23145 [Deltaproteobacteria bacterium]|nr:hypothetical protein [Deltaproteobacteria bacterium]MBN2674597.1 hypothetical protein [Deltaproteobacteria bacterium]
MSARPRITSMLKQSFKENFRPGLLLQSIALAIVLLYYFWPSFQLQLEALGRWKSEGGVLFSAISTALFGGVFPFVVIWFGEKGRLKHPLRLLAFYVLFWLWKGVEVDFMYRAQAWLYGDSNDWMVVLKKVVTDQFVYCPLWAVPTMMVFYLWKDSDFRFSVMKQKFSEDSFIRRILRVLLSNLVVWLPAVTIIYQLPLVLQLPLFNIVLAFWTLILNSVSQK